MGGDVFERGFLGQVCIVCVFLNAVNKHSNCDFGIWTGFRFYDVWVCGFCVPTELDCSAPAIDLLTMANDE